jgi:predicted secreted acid phosphatase
MRFPRWLLAAAPVAAAALVIAGPAGANTYRTATPPAAISAYYDSGRWAQNITVKVKRAKRNLRADLSAGRPPRRPAIVLDIDETSLFNAPCLEPVNWDLTGLATCAVQEGGIATPVRALYAYARSRHVTVAFISGRAVGLRAVTKRNLDDQGYGDGYKLTLRPADDTNDSVVPYKSGARGDLERHGYTILANLGDQRSDLAGGHAKRRYKLPNPVYVIT